MADVRQLVGLAAAGAAAYGLWRLAGRSATPDGPTPPSGLPGGLQPPLIIGHGSIASELQARGVRPVNAKGVAAGVMAESGGNPAAVNPKSGAFGLGQWLGSRQAELFRRYGPNPTMAQQLDFLVWELGGGDHGGPAVLAQSTPAGTLDAYIRRFMRPAAGAETTGDLARGKRYLG